MRPGNKRRGSLSSATKTKRRDTTGMKKRKRPKERAPGRKKDEDISRHWPTQKKLRSSTDSR